MSRMDWSHSFEFCIVLGKSVLCFRSFVPGVFGEIL